MKSREKKKQHPPMGAAFVLKYNLRAGGHGHLGAVS